MDKKLNLKQKVQEINERFALKAKKNLNTEAMDTKIGQIRKKLSTLAQKNNQDMQQIKLAAQALLHKTQQTNMTFQNDADGQLRELDELTQQLTLHIQSEIYQRKQRENQLVDNIQKKTRFLKQQIEKQQQFRDSIIEQISSTLEKDVPSLMKLIIDAAQQREDSQQKLTELVQGELTACKEKNNQFKQLCEQNEKKTFELIRDLALKAKKEIEEQRKIRQDTHDEILNYVEETCNKLGGGQ